MHTPTHTKLSFLAVLLLTSLLAGCGATVTVVQSETATAATPAPTIAPTLPPAPATPAGIWCDATSGIVYSAACEVYASAYGPASSDQPTFGGPIIAEACSSGCPDGQSATGSVPGPWALVVRCSLPSGNVQLVMTLVYAGRPYYSWGLVPCSDFAPTPAYEFRRATGGTVTISGPTSGDWDAVLVQR